MTQISSLDIGALAAKRQAASATGTPKGRGDFMAAYRHASNETRKAERHPDADRAQEARQDRADKAEQAEDVQQDDEAKLANKTEQADKADQAPKADDAPKAEAPKADDQAQAPKAEQPKADDTQAQAPVQQPQAQDQQAADAQQAEAAQQALDAQAMLAMQLATGGQLAQPAAQTTTQVDANAETQAVAQLTTQTQAQAQQADALAQAQALMQAQGVDADAADQAVKDAIAKAMQAAQQAQTQQQPAAQASQTAQAAANAQAQAGDALAQAASQLNVQSVQVSQQPKPQSPVAQPFANTAEAQPEKASNLMIELIDLKGKDTTVGSTTPVTTLDGALSTETQSTSVNLLADEDASDDALTADTTAQPAVPQLNGESKLDAAKATPAMKDAQAPARAEDVMPQVLKHAEQLKANQANAIKLQLYPEHLGKMEIKVMAHNGVLSAQISADSQSVKSMLETQVAALQRTFAELGLKVEKVEVALSSQNLGNDQFGGQAMQQGDQQQFGRQPQGSHTFGNSSYSQWLGDEPVDETVYAELDSAAAVNYVA